MFPYSCSQIMSELKLRVVIWFKIQLFSYEGYSCNKLLRKFVAYVV